MSFKKIEQILFYLLILFIPVQLGKHFWIPSSYVLGIRTDYLSPTLYFTDVLIGLLFLVWFWKQRKETHFLKRILKPFNKAQGPKSIEGKVQNDIKQSKFNIFYLIFPVIALSTFVAKDKIIASYGVLKFLEFLFFGFYVSRNLKKESLNVVVSVFSAAIIFVSAVTILQYLSQSSIGGFLYFLGERTFNPQTPGIANASINGTLILRPYATFPHPNVLAGYLTIVLAIILSNFQSCLSADRFPISNLKKTLYFVSLIFGSAALILTMSRVAIILWAVTLSWFLFNTVKDKTKRQLSLFGGRSSKQSIFKNIFKIASAKEAHLRLKIILVSILMIFLFIFLIMSPSWHRLLNIYFYDESVQARLDLIKISILTIKEHPVFGVGINNYLWDFVYNLKPISRISNIQPVHNIYLLIAVQTGITGLIFFISFIRFTLKEVEIKKQKQKNISFWNIKLILLVLILIFGFFDHYLLTLQQGQLLFAFVLGFCLTNDT